MTTTTGQYVTTDGGSGPAARNAEGEARLQAVHTMIGRMGEVTARMVRDAVASVLSLEETDRKAEEIAVRDDDVDRWDEEAEREILQIFATAPPRSQRAARMIGATLKVTRDYERIGDHAVNIAKTAHRVRYANLRYLPYLDLERFGEMVCAMITAVTDAYTRRDTAAARAVIADDDEVDVFYREATRELRAAMTEVGSTPDRVLFCSHLLFVCHYLERIGDHCCNIAERILAAEEGIAKSRVPERSRRLPRN
jgi:phosphate transport system protein